MTQEPELIEPDVAFRQEFIEYCQEFKTADEPFVHGQLPEAVADFAGLVYKWSYGAREANHLEGHVPGSVYWLVRDGRLLASARLRHRLNEILMQEGGHIGYEVRPSERRKGYATLTLKLILGKARARGLGRVLVTCDKDNIPSAQTIQKNGGIMENEVVSQRSGKLVQRYWIDL